MATASVIEDPVLAEAVRRLVDTFQPERIYLFGSRARGDAREDSDYDLMVILPDGAPDELQRNGSAHEATRGLGAAVNALVWKAERFNRRLHLKASLPATIIREGRLLYDHDPERVAEVRDWFVKAASDLRGARNDLVPDPPILDSSVYHCQQAAEKAIKGFLAWHDVTFRRTHELDELGKQVVGIDESLSTAMDRAKSLNAYAWKYRYPSHEEEPPRAEAETAIATAQATYDALLDHLPPAVRP